MGEKVSLPFGSSAWWAEHPRAHLVVVHAILSLSTDDRTQRRSGSRRPPTSGGKLLNLPRTAEMTATSL